MPAKWQTWMPFHIDRFRGSPDVQAMHPAARWGYLSLLASAWQTEDCSISSDPLDLATEAGLTDEMWTIYGPRILRKFHTRDDGRLANDVVYEEWKEAKRIFEARSEAARRTTETRSPSHNATVTVTKNYGDRHTGTETRTETGTLTVLPPRSVDTPLGRVARQIVCAHPTAKANHLAANEVTAFQLDAVLRAIALESVRSKTSKEAAAEYILGCTRAYSDAVSEWPISRQSRAVGIEKFFKECVFRQDTARWRHEDYGKRNRSQERTERNLDALRRASGLP